MVKENTISGTLYVVATPIGNLGDITFRAVKILKQVDLIAAEDTRHTGKLLSYYEIKKKLVSCHEHNETARIPQLINTLKQGSDIALVSDAGTPSVSDPGYRVVKAAAGENIKVVPIPGACAAVAGLSVSGLATDSFLFSGFLSRKKGKREKELQDLKNEKATLVFYESPKRIITLLEHVLAVIGDRSAMVAREITKMHEEYIRGNISDIAANLKLRDSVKGECVLFLDGCDCSNPMITEKELDKEILLALKDSDLKTGSLAKDLSKQYNLSKRLIYERILKLKSSIL